MFTKNKLKAMLAKGVVGGIIAACMGYMYKANLIIDKQIDEHFTEEENTDPTS